MPTIGHAGATPGQVFADREAIRVAGLHRHKMRGISGLASEPADAIILSGGYADDVDLGDEVIYTGEGGRDAATGTQVRDQTLTQGNAALVNSGLSGSPIRVFRRTGVGKTYEYGGLFYVDRYWPDRPATHGFLIWRYRLVKASADGETVAPPPPLPPDLPDRVPTTVQRIVRSTRTAQEVKELYDHRCQVCGDRITVAPDRYYSEAAHIRPLGLPHSGPDTASNLLCLCPNDHVRFDYGVIHIDSGMNVIDTASQQATGPLLVRPGHAIDPDHVSYHRDHWTSPTT